MNRPEFALIDWIRSRISDRAPVTLGIGDDAACLQCPNDRETLVAVDMLMEGVHFTFPPATARLAGRKALAVNLSDIAAMAGRPTSAFVSVALPNSRGMEFAREFHQGLIDLANEFDVVIAGGDTNSWDGPLVASVTIVGEPLNPTPVTRHGSKDGDWLFVTGTLGGSLRSGRHLTFPPRLREVQKLARLVDLHAMIDISDGLAADLHHLLEVPSIGAIVDGSSVPASPAAMQANDGHPPLIHALSDGEDFELLFTVSADDGQRLISEWNDSTTITKIGQITGTPGCWLRSPNGQTERLLPMGWTHSLGQDNGSEPAPGADKPRTT
jgi:thiamine-monophosphate kinase